MTDKVLRRLKRAELLEILYYLQKENEELKEEVKRLKEQPVQTVSGLPEDFMQQITQVVREAVSQQPKENRKKRR